MLWAHLSVSVLGGDNDLATADTALADFFVQVRASCLGRALSDSTAKDRVGSTSLGLVNTVFLLENATIRVETLSVSGTATNGAVFGADGPLTPWSRSAWVTRTLNGNIIPTTWGHRFWTLSFAGGKLDASYPFTFFGINAHTTSGPHNGRNWFEVG